MDLLLQIEAFQCVPIRRQEGSTHRSPIPPTSAPETEKGSPWSLPFKSFGPLGMTPSSEDRRRPLAVCPLDITAHQPSFDAIRQPAIFSLAAPQSFSSR